MWDFDGSSSGTLPIGDYGLAFGTDELDLQIRADFRHALPVTREWIPAELTPTHWWWHLPDSERVYLAFREWPPGHDLSGERLVRAILQHAQFSTRRGA